MTENQQLASAPRATKKMAVCSTFGVGLAADPLARPVREAGGKPAVVYVSTGNTTCRFAGNFLRERRDSNPRPRA
jgi:hypothetical protein